MMKFLVVLLLVVGAVFAMLQIGGAKLVLLACGMLLVMVIVAMIPESNPPA
jgi:hypothetical protein